METKSFDVLVIGAGAAGLQAALEIALTGRTVGVVEAKERCGGRMLTVFENGYPVELGAEFVHGKLPLTLGLLKKAGIKTYAVLGTVWQYKDGRLSKQEDFIEDYADLEKKLEGLKEDLSVEDFLKGPLSGAKYEALRFSLKNYVEGYYAADLSKASTFALREELAKGDEEQYRIEGGYQPLVDYLQGQCLQNGVQFFFSSPIKNLRWQRDNVEALTEGPSFSAKRALVTVSVGVLQNEGIAFSPALPEKIAAAKSLGFGCVQKNVLRFDDVFWGDPTRTDGKDLTDVGFLFSEAEIPTWWTQQPKAEPQLAGWLGGPRAGLLRNADEKTMTQKATHSLSRIFKCDAEWLLQKLQSAHFRNWSADPHFGGAYCYEVVNGISHQRALLQPVEHTVYFSGEGLHCGPQIGTVEAALSSGRDVAHRLIADFPNVV